MAQSVDRSRHTAMDDAQLPRHEWAHTGARLQFGIKVMVNVFRLLANGHLP